MKKNYCVNCEEVATFIWGRCETCMGRYDDVVPASYRTDYKWDYGKKTNASGHKN